MKLIIVQLSDMHGTASANAFTLKIDRAVSAIKSLGKFDNAVLVFSGDLVDTASPNEFSAAAKVIGNFVSKLGRVIKTHIQVKIVPGNHDMYLPKDSRGASEIESWNKDEHLHEELDRLKYFFEYANRKGCFKNQPIFDCKTVTIGGVKIQFCLLNSAPFSTRQPEDKQFHYLPAYVADHLERDPNADLKITVMHHHYEWCEWNTKEMLKNAIATDDFTFFGHDHKAETIVSEYGYGDSSSIIMGGKIDLDSSKESAFNAVIYDSESSSIERIEFQWSVDDKLFLESNRKLLTKKRGRLTPSKEYINKLLEDDQGISECFTDYFVFPKLVAEGSAFSTDDYAEYVTADNIFSALQTDRAIRITGASNSGKTALLRYLYNESTKKGFIPLLIEKRDYRDSALERMFKGLFEEQYGETWIHGYDAYLQADNAQKVVFIDDADLIDNRRAKEKLIEDILDSGKSLIYTTTEKNHDLEEIVKEKLQGKEGSTIEILPFYKETRDELIEKVCQIKQKGTDEIDAIKMALDYMVQCQTSFFTFTPSGMLQYIKYFLNGGSRERTGVQTISMVFENNIRTAILTVEKQEVANVYLLALEFIAKEMYFNHKCEKIDNGTFCSIISDYNSKRKVAINPKQFLSACKDAKLLKDSEDSFDIRFYDNNTYAYFIAKALSRDFERDHTDLENLRFVMEHICFGINDTIILFLSFIRSNTKLIVTIAEKADELLHDYPEWNIKESNLPFLQQYTELPDSVPTTEERHEVKKEIEHTEQRRHELIKFRGIFDYDEKDVHKVQYVALRALKYTQLVGRAFVDQYGGLEAEEIEKILGVLYSVPQKVVYVRLKPFQDHSEEIIKRFVQFATEKVPNKKISEDLIRKLFGQAGTLIALDILDNVALTVSNRSTIGALRNGPQSTMNDHIMELMMEENTGDTPEFISRAIAMRKELEKNPYSQLLISQIARKHIFYTPSIEHRMIDRLISGKVLSRKSRPALLYEEQKKKGQESKKSEATGEK